MWYFAGAIYAIKGLILVFGAFLAFETRKVTVPALNDSKFIGMSVYNVVVLCLIGVPIALIMKEEIEASYVLISLFIMFATTLTICLVFIPKIVKRNHEFQSGGMLSKSCDSSAATRRGDRHGPFTFKSEGNSAVLRDEVSNLKNTLEQVTFYYYWIKL